MFIGDIREPTEELYLAMQRLIPQLGPHKIPPNQANSKNCSARKAPGCWSPGIPMSRERLWGYLCLTLYRVPTGGRSIVEDFVVDEEMRKKGVGEALIRRAMDVARAAGANGLSLTSNPSGKRQTVFIFQWGFNCVKPTLIFINWNKKKRQAQACLFRIT
jgi:GNAT superfamily N-acetyltransferase